MLKFYEVLGSRDSDLFKGKINGSEYPNKPWNEVVKYFNNNPLLQTKIVSGTRNPKLNFEFEGKVFSRSITGKTVSKEVIIWVEKLISMYSKKEETAVEVRETKIEPVFEERQPVSRTKVNSLAGTSMAIALAGFVGAVVGSIISEEESKSELPSDDFLLVDDNDEPIDFRAKMKKEREKFL